ncbi:MAG: amidohydrolase family protein, partial [Gemmatimonadetes bacterium]|nr:amidohydrolase family protein [Gemmatimonadota bacterium]
MRIVVMAVLGLGLATSAIAQDTPNPLLIRDITIVSPEREAPLENGWVAIEGGRIRAVGTGEPDFATDAYHVHDGGGRFLTPGLIDGHVHLAGVPGMRYPVPDALVPLVEAYKKQLPRSYLYFGFTTVIDLNVIDRPFIDELEAAPLHPDVYDCDSALALANGYPMAFFPPETRFESHPNFLYDPRQADAIPVKYAPEDHSPAAAVGRVAEAGAICVKTHFEDGFGPAKIWPTPTAEMISDVIAESHARNLTVTMHANSYEAYKFAVETGVDVIVHGMWNWDGLGDDDTIPEPIRDVLDEIVDLDTGFMPTLQVLGGLQSMFDPDFLDDPMLRAVLPAALIDWYGTEDGRWFQNELRSEEGFAELDDAEIQARMDIAIQQGTWVVTDLVARHARLLFGSDTPSSPTYGNPPGYNSFLEM